jgi:glucose-1-phosphate adenylyltransferase
MSMIFVVFFRDFLNSTKINNIRRHAQPPLELSQRDWICYTVPASFCDHRFTVLQSHHPRVPKELTMRVLAMIMAGGASEALSVLTAVRSEASIPFGGKFRIIDFPLSNCVNSGIFNVVLLTQYMPRSLNEHVGVGKPWDLDRSQGGVRLLQPYVGRDGSGGWQRGTADSVRYHLDFVQEQRVDAVLILAGDHIYKMDYGQMLRFHQEHNADVTIAVRQVSPFETHRFGIVSVDADKRVTDFREKPRRSLSTLASMGIYVFNYQTLIDVLTQKQEPPHLDFGRDVLPAILPTQRVMAYPFESYWADVGTLQAYWEANMALLGESPALDLHDPEWVIHTRSEERPPAKIGPKAQVGGNLLSNGCIVEGIVERSIISPGVYVSEGAVIRDSIIMNDTWIGPGVVVDRSIVDKEVHVAEGTHLGCGDDNTPNQKLPEFLNTGLTVIGKKSRLPAGVCIGHNVVVNPYSQEKAFTSLDIASGASI